MGCAYCELDTAGNHESTCPVVLPPVLVGSSSDGLQMVFHELRIVTVIGGHQLLAYCPCGWTAGETYLSGGIPLEEMRAEYRDHVAPETPKEEQ
ncbi:MAG TPA: hypothetical protein VF377_06805 [Acidimicrobiia bacterium]